MPKQEILDKSYLKFLNNLKSILVHSLKIIEEQRAKTYWQTGQLISTYLLESKQYGDGLFIRLSQDLGIRERTLYRSVQFFEVFPNLSALKNLSWNHYILLLAVEDANKRDFFKKQAVRQSWSSRQLQKSIRIYKLQLKNSIKKLPKSEKPPKLSVTRGKLFTYKLIKPERITPQSTELLVDCGFDIWREIPLKGISKPEDGQIVESNKTDSGYKFQDTDATTKQLYTYKSFVEKVTDADTIWVNIDLGFESWTRQKLRFRGIDAPEISTKKGERAKEFVEATLSKVKFIVIRSASLDKYGRPLSDILYLEGETDPQKVLEEGIYLNQQLLDLGLAKIMD